MSAPAFVTNSTRTALKLLHVPVRAGELFVMNAVFAVAAFFVRR